MTEVLTEPAREPFSPALRRAIGVVMIGASLSFLDTTIVNVAAHSLAVDLHAGLSAVQRVVTACLLALAAVIPVTGWAARRFGAPRLYVVALAVFTLGSVLCACSPNLGTPVVARALQGVGGGAIMPVGTIIWTAQATKCQMGTVIALLALPIIVAPALGPVLGGLLIQGIGWQAIFWLNVPFGVLGIVLARRLLPREAGRDAGLFDAFGLVLAGFVRHALRVPRPMLDLRLYTSREFTAASVATFALGAANYGGMILMPLYLQTVRGEDVVVAGLLVAPTALGALIAAPFTDRYGAGFTSFAGAVVLAVGTVPFLLLTAGTSYRLLCGVMVVRGIGFGLSTIPAMTAAYQALRPEQIPDATPQLNVLQRVGGAIGTAVLTVVLSGRLSGAGTAAAQAAGFARTFWWVLGITVVAAVPTLLLAGTERRARRRAGATP
ncbi:MAG TPA: MDR family MFS transporter [Cellulomonas sp.]